ncbi:4F2 cell-surface antigen heavy chain-like [Panonychus citri]|uniref:4F2 cell-surface antigen heavy chain-like n=1 Tax=Panonychus citri TaxID=50023 RepID=UPI002306ED59|nr:4F2 cell-surface antigen heavy chain-like [Panonychus citri]
MSDLEMDAKEPLAGRSSEPSPSKVQFVSSSSEEKNGEAKVEFAGYEVHKVGLNKDELMKYANDPFWIKVRMISFILFWVAWWSTLIGSTVIIFLAPKCPLSSSSSSGVNGTMITTASPITTTTFLANSMISSISS